MHALNPVAMPRSFQLPWAILATSEIGLPQRPILHLFSFSRLYKVAASSLITLLTLVKGSSLTIVVVFSTVFHLVYMTSSPDQAVALRKSRRLTAPCGPATEALVMPDGCELVAGTFVVFRWQEQPCILQVNLTQYCWGGQRSGALELVLEDHNLTHSPLLYHINSKLVTTTQWSWLREIFIVVRRLFDANEACDTARKVHWLNIFDCRLAHDLMLRQCHRYHFNLYPTGSLLCIHLKRYGVELEAWYGAADEENGRSESPTTPPPPPPSSPAATLPPTTPPSSAEKRRTEDNASPSTGLGEREWLSDIHLANLMFLLLHGQLDLPLERRDDFQCLYLMTDHLLVRTLAQAEPGSLLWHAKSGRGVTLAFVNPDNDHWRLVILDGIQRQVVLFDPLGRPLPVSIVRAVSQFMGPAFCVTDLQLHVQAEGWNCGVWCLYVASRYIQAALAAADSTMNFATVLVEPQSYTILDDHGSTSMQHHRQNRTFANELRRGYTQLLDDASIRGRLLYSADDALALGDDEDVPYLEQARPANNNTTVWAGTARSALQQRRFCSRPLAEQVWVDLTDQAGSATSVENEEAIEQSLEDLSDHFIEFREDNIDNPVASTLRYSLPANLQSDALKAQIEQFRAYRRERFSLFRRGPLVEETTIASNISSLLRFLGYLHYEHELAVLDMGVFALDNISQLVLKYVEWLERRRGCKRVSPTDKWQPVSCATVANYLNSLVAIVKFQLCQQLDKRDPLIDQLRNLRSQAESYSFTAKRFEKAHPEWCTWAELQMAREKCRAAFDDMDSSEDTDRDSRAYLLQLRELCLLCLFTICPPPRCSVIRLLEWDKTLVASGASAEQWHLDLTDVGHAATRHKTHKRKGALRLPLPKMLSPYLSKLRAASVRGVNAVFPPGLLSAVPTDSTGGTSSASDALMDTHSFTYFVKRTFRKYTPGGQAPNPSLLRSIFTTWLYSLRYDTEDDFLQQIKASSAKWKAHSDRVAGAVYNKEQVYQKREFALLLSFCEEYATRHAYDRQSKDNENGEDEEADTTEPDPTRQQRQTRKRSRPQSEVNNSTDSEAAFTVEKLIRVRVSERDGKQVSVQWEGYRRPTWEPYESIQQQLPKLIAELEARHTHHLRQGREDEEDEDDRLHSFVKHFIAEHHIDPAFRWRPDRLNELEQAAACWVPPIHETADQLRRAIMSLVRSK